MMDKPAAPYRPLPRWLRHAALAVVLGALSVMVVAAIAQSPVRITIGESVFTIQSDESSYSCSVDKYN